jgi:hypothetical protein
LMFVGGVKEFKALYSMFSPYAYEVS